MNKILLSILTLSTSLLFAQGVLYIPQYTLTEIHDGDQWVKESLKYEVPEFELTDTTLISLVHKEWNYVDGDNYEQDTYFEYYFNRQFKNIGFENTEFTGILKADSSFSFSPNVDGGWDVATIGASSYDQQDNLIEQITEINTDLFGLNFGIMPFQKIEPYYTNNVMDGYVTYSLFGAPTVTDSTHLTRDGSGNITMIERFEVDDNTGDWIPSDREDYTYDAEGNWLTKYDYYYDELTLQLEPLEYVIRTYVNGKIATEEEYYYSNNAYLLQVEMTYDYPTPLREIVNYYDENATIVRTDTTDYVDEDTKSFKISYSYDQGVAVPTERKTYTETFAFNEVSPYPSAPSNLEIIETSTGPEVILRTTSTTPFIKLQWQDNSDNEEAFVIERSTDGVTFGVVGNVPANETTFTDATTLNGETYIYRVLASRGEGNYLSRPSETASGTTNDKITAIDPSVLDELTSVYPNPSSGNIKILTPNGIRSLTIYNNAGNIVHSSLTEEVIDLSTFEDGLYHLQIVDIEDNVFLKNIVKQ